MSNNDRIEAALADLELQEVPNYFTTAKKHKVVRTTLMRWFTGKPVSNYKANTEYRQALNIAQEKVLLGHIQQLVTRVTPPIPMLVGNFAEEIYGSRLGKNLITQFIQCHSVHFKTLYSRNIDNL